MKQLELELKERLLIVEKIVIANGEEIDISESMIFGIEKMVKAKFICKGSELTEEILKKIVDHDDVNIKHPDFINEIPFLNYKSGAFEYYTKFSALESFISAIKAQGYYWDENPIKIIERGEASEHERVKNQNEWQEAQSRTFNLENTLIFEILE